MALGFTALFLAPPRWPIMSATSAIDVKALFVLRAGAPALDGVSLARRGRKRHGLTRRMEPLWSPVVANGGNRSQMVPPPKPINKPKPLPWVATGCREKYMVRRGSTVRVRQRAWLNRAVHADRV
jgi:hypothetical protein